LSYWALDSTFIAHHISMKSHLTTLTVFMIIGLFAFGQKKNNVLHLKSGAVNLSSNVTPARIDSFNRKLSPFKKDFLIIQFDEVPSELTKQQLAAQGIELLNYIPDNAYTANVIGRLNAELLLRSKATAIYQPSPQQKMDASLASGLPPATSVKIPGTVDVWINFVKNYTTGEVISLLKPLDAHVLSTDLSAYHVLCLRIAVNKIFQLAEQPFIEYVIPAPPPDQPLNSNSRSLSHANVLNASVSDGGKGLNGEGVVIGMGDNSDIQSHVDFTGRLINRTAGGLDFHGIYTSGIAAGGGIVNEFYRGYLPKATIVSQLFNAIWTNASTYVADYNMVVTNNSYGAMLGCENNGIYDLSSNILDQQAFDFPYLQHVFAVGNSGALTCAPYPTGFRTALGAYQTAKNVICVGNTDASGVLSQTSSRGPVRDGRIKPEVTAQGTNVISTWPGNQYAGNGLNGSSVAAPAVTGGVGLLYQYYRRLNGNSDPKSALIKALICNGATDKGNSGPDFKYGFGSMNLLRSVNMLENNHYFAGSISNANSITHAISVPANTAKLKVMLYWHDPASSILAAKALVNDLDLELVSPASSTLFPLVLDSTLAHVNDLAINAADHTNNIEQIVIDNPAPGNYNIKVKGTAINQNPSQEYFIVYDAIPNSIQLTSPVGGEGLVPGEFVNIAWDAYGDETTTYDLEYSLDAGITWNGISNNVAAGTQFFSWQVPAVASDKAIIRIIKNATGQLSQSNLFTIIGLPAISLSAVQCEGYFAIEWPAISNATEYQVLMLRGNEMVPVGNTAITSYILKGLSKDSIYWVSVRAGINGKWGRRSVAISRQPNSGNCSGSISDNDLKLNVILSPVTGRKFTSTALSNANPVKIEIKNLDDNPVTNFNLKYSIDGGNTWQSENVAATILPGEIYTHQFGAAADLAAEMSYDVLAVVTNDVVDVNAQNDTLKMKVRQLPNQPLNLATAFNDDLETLSAATYESETVGLPGDDRYDFENTTTLGRLRSFINSGISLSGSKALSMDIKAQSAQSNINYLVGTFNLSNYNAITNELRLDFQFNFHGDNITDGNKVWIRGSDTDPWIFMYDLFSNKADKGIYKLSTSIELSDSLVKYGQNFSSAFQVRWTQNGSFQIVGKRNAAGVSIDDIRIYEVMNDAQLLSIDAPVGHNCNLNNAVPVKVSIHNGTKTTLTQVPVKYSVNGGTWVSETIASIAAESTIQFTFSTLTNLSQQGTYIIKAVVDYSNDNFHNNDTALVKVQSIPLIVSFPYLQNFENNNGGWFSEGTPDSWQYGTPISPKIKTAASGVKAWKTNLSGDYNNEEVSYLYSPCFNVSNLSKPTLSFSVALDIEDCGATPCDQVWIEYSTDGIDWLRIIDTTHTAVNWYNKNSYWSTENYTRWHVVTASLPIGINSLRLRFVLHTDQGATREGIAIDDVHVYDNLKGIYVGSTTTSITQTISGGNNWIDFEKDGKLVASILPNNQNLGLTNVQAYISDSVRNTGTQYYHNRSLTIKPAQTSLSDSVTIRFYFLDSEAEELLNATGCAGCAKPSSAYELGVSQYDDYDTSFENGSLNDNQQGLWRFITPGNTVKVPFDKGYYVEFKVKDFSEFWLNSGALNGGTTLAVKLFQFSAKKTNEDVSLNWTVGTETNVDHYEIELARSNSDMQLNNFQKIGEVVGKGNSVTQQEYSFTDKENFKSGTRYYRIKTINQDGSFSYSVTRSVIFETITNWQVVPNPSSGLLYLVYEANLGEQVNIQVTDAIGKIVKTYTATGSGSLQKLSIDLSANIYAAGIYLLQTSINKENKTFKIYKR
jgi:hypothetical protein